MTELKPIQKKSLVDLTEERIITLIRETKLIPGDPLPGELFFASKLNVSRSVVREAFSRLRGYGLIETKKKRGIVLKEADIVLAMEKIFRLPVFQDDARRELFEMRIYVEIGMAETIFAKKTDCLLAELETIVHREMTRPDDRGLAIECDIVFHTRLYQLTGNQLLERFQVLLDHYFNGLAGNRFCVDRFNRPNHITHHDLLEELKDGTAPGFRTLMKKHLIVHLERGKQENPI